MRVALAAGLAPAALTGRRGLTHFSILRGSMSLGTGRAPPTFVLLDARG